MRPVSLTRSATLLVPCRDPYHAAHTLELWPAGLQSPTGQYHPGPPPAAAAAGRWAAHGFRPAAACCQPVPPSRPLPAAVYYMIRERQLAFQIHAVAREGPAAWRPPSTPAAAAPSALLQRRGCRPLALLVPHAATGVTAADTAVYVRSINVACCPPSAAPAPKPRAETPTAPLVPLARLATPPTLDEQPAKRSRRLSPARPGAPVRAAPSAPAAGHLIAPACTSQCGYQPAAAPVVLHMPALALSAGSAPAAPSVALARGGSHPGGHSSASPLYSWLQKIRAMLSPRSQHVAPVFAY